MEQEQKFEPLVTVVIPTFNRPEKLKKAVQSVLAQSYKNLEIIVVDDFSEVSAENISDLDNRIIFLRNSQNLGVVEALNRGVSEGRGEYIARLDDDDYWTDPEKLKKQIGFLHKKPDYSLVGGGAVKLDREGRKILEYSLPEEDGEIRKKMLTGETFCNTTIVFKRNDWQKMGGYDKEFDGIEDWDLWLKLGLNGKLYNFPETFVAYSGHDKQNPTYFEKGSSRFKRLSLSLKVVRKYRKFYPSYWGSVLRCWMRYFYSLLPFREALRPLMFKLKKYF